MKDILKTPNLNLAEARIVDLVNLYIKLPNYGDNPSLHALQAEAQTFENTQAQNYYDTVRTNAWTAAKEQQNYGTAINIVTRAMSELGQQPFSAHDKKAIDIFLLRRLGRIYEHQATFGQEQLPLNNPDRRKNYLLAATLYMEADFELDGITDFSARICEALIGAGKPDLGMKALKAFYGNDITIGTPQLVADRLSDKNKVLTEVTAALGIELWDKLPPSIDKAGSEI